MRATASATGRCGAGGPTDDWSPRSPTCRRAARSTSAAGRAPMRSGWRSRGGRSRPSTCRRWRCVERRRPPSGSASASSGYAATLCTRSLDDRSFDLVSLQYPALPKAAGKDAVAKLLDTVRRGGRLLAVYHDLDDEHRAHMKDRGFDPDDYVGVDDLRVLLDDEFTVELEAGVPGSTRHRAPRTSPTSSCAPTAADAANAERETATARLVTGLPARGAPRRWSRGTRSGRGRHRRTAGRRERAGARDPGCRPARCAGGSTYRRKPTPA